MAVPPLKRVEMGALYRVLRPMELSAGMRYTTRGREATRSERAPWRRDQHRGQKRGDGIGFSGYKHQKGEKVIAIIDNHGYVLAPVPVAPVNETDMVLLPEGLKALKKIAKEVGLDLNGAYLNLDGGFDSIANRKCIFNAGMIPNIKENPRNRKTRVC